MRKAYRGKRSWVPVIEVIFGLYFSGAIYYAWDEEIWTSLPYLLLFQVGFLYVGLTSLFELGGRGKSVEVSSGAAQPIT